MQARLRTLVTFGSAALLVVALALTAPVNHVTEPPSVAFDPIPAAATTSADQVAYAAFTRNSESANPGALRIVGSDGVGDHLIATPTPIAADVGWNPAGTELAYVAELPDSNHQVWTINADGSGARAVTPEGYDSPVWSPDGTKLAVTTDATSSSPFTNVAVADLAAGTTTTITNNSSANGTTFGSAVWAPDGSKLAFVTVVYSEGSGGTGTINVVNADGSGRIALPEAMDGAFDTARELAWSPDNMWLAFDGYLAQGDNSRGVLQIVHPDGTGLRTIDAGSSTSEGDGDIGGFSPDGTSVLAELDSNPPSGIVAVSLSGAVTTIRPQPAATAGNTPGDSGAVWSSSGTDVVFCEQTFNGPIAESNLYATGAHGSELKQLTTSGQACDGAVASESPRYAGADRVGTAISSSRANFSHAPAVVIARSDLYPDALAAAPLAGRIGGPILLSPPGGTTPALNAEIKRLGATTAYIIGDTTALSAQVDADVTAAGITMIVRIGGTTRYDTAALIAERVGGAAVYVVRGDDFADAAAVSALAAYQQRPVLLTPATTLSSAVTDAVTALHATSATIVGGTSAVSAAAEQTLNTDGVTTTRIAGADRWATSAAVASAAVAAGMTGPPWLASGLNWPDAVSAGPAAAATKGVLLLVATASLAGSPASQTWLAAHPSTVIVAVGGPDVVSPEDVTTARG